MALPRAVVALFDQQLAVAAGRQLRLHLTHDQIMGLRRRGRIESVARGVYRIPGGGSPPGQEAMIAWLRAGPGAIVTGPAVLGMRRIDGFEPSDPFEVLLPVGRRLTTVTFPWRHDPLPQRPSGTWNGMAVVPVDRALCDSARPRFAVAARRLRVGYDSARWRGLTHPVVVRATCEELGRGDPGATFFLRLDADRRLDAESEGERSLVEIARLAGLTLDLQVWLADDMRVDAVVHGLPVVLEYLGSVDHHDAASRAADRRRASRLAALGYRMLGVRPVELRDPNRLAARLRREAARAASLSEVSPATLRAVAGG